MVERGDLEVRNGFAEFLSVVVDELVRRAAQSKVISTDDTSAQILKLIRPPEDKRTGVFTTAVVAKDEEHPIALFFTGPQHAGENLRDLLVKRAAQLPPPIQMSDAASRNVPKVSEEAKTTLANCLAHGRRHVVDAVGAFPDKCQHILEAISKAFKADAEARALGLDPAARLRYHKQHSQPVMKELHRWLQSVAGAPIDNNICERAIKKAVLQRKNSYFFRSLKGADVSDIYMSLIHTCELNGVGAFDYLTQVLKNDARARANPGAWLPWNYREQLCPALVEV